MTNVGKKRGAASSAALSVMIAASCGNGGSGSSSGSGATSGTSSGHGASGSATSGASGSASTGAAGSSSTGASSSGDITDASQPDSAIDGSMCAPAALDSSACNDVPFSTTVITETCASGEPPQAQGGTIRDGLYVLQSVVFYGEASCTPAAVATSWNICGTHWDVAQRNPAEAGETQYRLSYSASVGATTVSLTPICESGTTVAAMTRGFSVTAGGFSFITTYPQGAGSYVVVGTYSKQ